MHVSNKKIGLAAKFKNMDRVTCEFILYIISKNLRITLFSDIYLYLMYEV